jgi:hypothetical protein
MSEHVNVTTRDQTVLFPNTIDKYVEKENPVKFIDAFVDSLNLEKQFIRSKSSIVNLRRGNDYLLICSRISQL